MPSLQKKKNWFYRGSIVCRGSDLSMLILKKMKRILVSLLSLLLVPAMLLAQAQITGEVLDEQGEPVIGANVVVSGTSTGTITDFDGRFALSCDSKATLEISYMGMQTQTIALGGKTHITVTMHDDTELLEEVVVVGYGTMRKADLTGSVGSMGKKDMEAPVANIGQALQGKVSGVQVIDAGSPGDNVSIKIRGLGSINNCDPLVVIDGIPTDLGINAINMNDVERLDVLKDASATAIYGSRGANGVVMITTKSGASGKGKLTLNAGVGMQTGMNIPTMLTSAQYAQLNNEMMYNAQQNANPDWVDPSELTQSTDWMKEMMQMGLLQNYNLNYSGGSDKNHYYVSFGYQQHQGLIKTSDYKRFTLQEKSDAQVLKWLRFDHALTFSHDIKSGGAYSISDGLRALPIYSIKDASGEWTGPEGNSMWYGSTRNPIGPMEVYQSTTKGYNLLTSLAAEITFCKQLKFKTMFAFDGKFWFTDSFSPAYDWKPSPTEISSRYQSNNRSFTYTWDNYFTYDQTFKKDHHLNVMAGMSMQWNDFMWSNMTKEGFMFDNVNQFDNGQEPATIGGSRSEWALMSFMGRANYNYADRYMLTFTVRGDGSSRFGKNHRWGCFPSGAVAWRISEEEFFPEQDAVNDLKLRAGYGMTGSQASVSNYGYLATYETSVYPFGKFSSDPEEMNKYALISTTLANPDIHWETVSQANVGFDMTLAYNRLTLGFDWYWKNTTDMLVKASVPITSGFEDTSVTYANAGKVRNTGFEISVNSLNIKNGPVQWETSLNVTFNRNRILDLNSDVPYYINQIGNSYLTILQEGLPINCFYGFVTDGIFQNEEEVAMHAFQAGAQPGDIRFRDLNNDGRITDDDRTVIGNPNPQWMFSMGNTLTTKFGLEFSFYLQGVAGNDIYNANDIDLTGMSAAYNQTTKVLDRWTPDNPNATLPRAVYGDPNQNTRVSDRYVEDGSYLRLKNITLAYNFPSKLIKKATMEQLRLSFSCENVATATRYTGFDPEVAQNGIDLNRYPLARTYNFTLNIGF